MTILHLNLNTRSLDALSPSETYCLCLMITRQVFVFLKKFLNSMNVPDNYQTNWCQYIVDKNVDILSAAKAPINVAKFCDEPVLLKIHSCSCVILNPGRDLTCFKIGSNDSDLLRTGPITLIKLMVEISHKALLSLNRRLPHNDNLRQINIQIQHSMEIITSHLCRAILLIPDEKEYPANIHTHFSTIILEVEREFVNQSKIK